jgi:high-affinity K+ transport system ATPase subunit B
VDTILHQQARLTPVQCIAKISMMLVFTLLFISKSLHAEPPRPKDAADTSKVVVTEEYFKTPEKKTALFDSSGKQLSTQQMVEFIKNELIKLNEQITAIVQKAAPDSSSAMTASDVDVMKLFIIKGKLESMEKTLDEWTKQWESEMNSKDAAPAISPKSKP